MPGTIRNILKNAMRPGYLTTMAHKLLLRADGVLRRDSGAEVRAWCQKHAEDFAPFARSLHADFWREAEEFSVAFEAQSVPRLESLSVQLGGGGHYAALYFLTRLKRPSTFVETGVAAGFSSAGILSAMARNGHGHLYSSDFPYFRLDEPERYIGCLVDDSLKGRWSLHVRGDRDNLPKILQKTTSIDLVHYDSDKSYAGRRWAMRLMEPHLSPGATVLMDDIEDNSYFRSMVESRGAPFRVFADGRKYFGALGL